MTNAHTQRKFSSKYSNSKCRTSRKDFYISNWAEQHSSWRDKALVRWKCLGSTFSVRFAYRARRLGTGRGRTSGSAPLRICTQCRQLATSNIQKHAANHTPHISFACGKMKQMLVESWKVPSSRVYSCWRAPRAGVFTSATAQNREISVTVLPFLQRPPEKGKLPVASDSTELNFPCGRSTSALLLFPHARSVFTPLEAVVISGCAPLAHVWQAELVTPENNLELHI